MSDPDTTVLVVDDSSTVREMIATVLRRGGYEVMVAEGGEEALRAFARRRPDLVILDLHMPGMDGWQTLERIRQVSELPVLMLTGSGDERSRVAGLLKGADDYLVKPASAAELLARVMALLRRSRRRGEDAGEAAVYDDGLVRVDLVGRTAHVGGAELALTPLEFKLLAAFVRRPGVTLSKDDLLRDVWNDYSGGPGDHVKLYVGYLRRKLAAATEHELIETVRGFGYRWVGPGDAAGSAGRFRQHPGQDGGSVSSRARGTS